MPVFVFRTNVAYWGMAGIITGQLQCLPGVQRCNFDLSDVDRILRVEGPAAVVPVVQQTVRKAGYFCEELE
jgi:hypothetical protein